MEICEYSRMIQNKKAYVKTSCGNVLTIENPNATSKEEKCLYCGRSKKSDEA